MSSFLWEEEVQLILLKVQCHLRKLIVAIVHSLQKDSGGEFLPHIAIPTTLSVAGMSRNFTLKTNGKKPREPGDTRPTKDIKLGWRIFIYVLESSFMTVMSQVTLP